MEELNDSIATNLKDTTNTLPSYQEEIYGRLFNLINEVRSNTIPTNLTQTDLDEWTGIFLAAVAAFGTIFTYIYVRKDYKQEQINKLFQQSIFKDLLRHNYRNFIVLHALKIKLETDNFNSYPSEEHILKFKSLPEDLRINKFTTSAKNYDVLHRFELLLRNVNIEVDVFLDHLKNQELDMDIKKRDLKTMSFKFPMISEKIIEILTILDNKDFRTEEQFRSYLKSISSDNVNRKKSKPQSSESQEIQIENRGENYFDKLGLTEELDNDIKLEYDIIQLIPFKKVNEV